MLRTAILLAAALTALPAFADEVRLVRPIEAGSLATESLSLVAYHVVLPDDAYQVTATWLGADDVEPSRLTLRLEDGDSVSFSLPGHPETRFTFGREIDAVTIEATPAERPARTASL